MIALQTNGTGRAIIIIEEERIDMVNAHALKCQLKDLSIPEAEEPGGVIVDMSHLRRIDSSGLAVLIVLYRKLGPCLELQNVSNHIRRVLRISCLDRLFNVSQCA